MTGWLARALSPTARPTAREILAAALALAGAGLLAFGPNLSQGGFYLDDWSIAADYHFADAPRFWTTVGVQEDVLGGRPVGALLLPLPHALFGLDHELHLASALALGIGASLCLFLALRMLALPALHAGAVAVLALLLPWSDVLRLWPGVSVFEFSVGFLLLGVVVALSGLRRSGRKSVLLHAGADVLYLLSVLTYEATGAVALVAGALYLGRSPLPTALRRWAADVVVVVAALAYSLATTVSERHVGSLGERLGDIGPFLHESALLLVSTLVPFGSLGSAATALVLLASAAIAALALVRGREQPELRRWAYLMAVGAGIIGATYFMYLGSDLHPKDPGVNMRINIVAGLGFVIVAYAIVGAGSRMALRSTSSAAALTVAVAAVIAGGYVNRVRDDADDWARAARLQERVLHLVAERLPPLQARSTLLTFGFPAQTGPEVPVFYKSWDLDGAVEIQAERPGLQAFPVYEGVTVRCGPRRLVVEGEGSYGTSHAAYGRIYFLGADGGEGMRIESAPACSRALRQLRPGPLRAGS